MNDDGFQLQMPAGHPIHVHRWLPQGPTHATLLVAHGMAEHGARYERLAQALNAAGWAVYALDWPGHGRSVDSAAELGHFADHDGWNHALDALHRVRGRAAAAQGGKPLFLLGHSMGSFLSQYYIVEHGEGLAGVVLSATTGDMGPTRAAGAVLLKLESMLLGVRHRSALAEALSFKAFNKKFAPARTPADWLSRDAAEVDKYVADPLCGFRCSAALWASLLSAGASLRDPRRLSCIPKSLPVLLIAGSKDAVSGGAHGPEMLAQAYRAAGLNEVTVKIYEGGRHELLNEIPQCRDQVTADLLGWLGKHSN
ncbi:MAG: alpha/beta hydrolase [Nevskia sp.]|nr:alpha/beta hydrolase [Nevskia sp.]